MKTLATILTVAGLAAAASVHADVTTTDLQVAARALTFMEEPLNGTIRVGILHSPSDARSMQDAQALRTLIGRGMRVGTVELRHREICRRLSQISLA